MDVNALKRVIPEMMELLKQRVRIMQRILLMQPIGRRALAGEMMLTERVLRKELDFLRDQGLIFTSAAGVYLTDDGCKLLEEIEDVVSAVEGRNQLARRLSKLLSIPCVVIVEGDSDEASWVKDNLGRKAAAFLQNSLQEHDVVAVTGGTTLASMATHMPANESPLHVQIVPARGGVGERVDIQANTVASLLADKLNGTSVMLHVPDRLSEETLEQLLTDPYVHDRLCEIREATIVVHGIGDALAMAKRRKMSDSEIGVLSQKKAVAEAFGYYFGADGQVVYAMTTVGLRLDDLDSVRLIMAVAGGRQKAVAVAAAAAAYRIDVLVTDEGVAEALLREGSNKTGEVTLKE